MSAEGVAARVAAARVLQAVRFAGTSLKAELPAALSSLKDSRDRALCEAMVMSSCRFLHRYERLLSRLLQRPLAKRNSAAHCLLLLGLAQLEAIGIAPHAAISATVEASRALQQAPLAGLINAVLRRYLREREALESALADDPEFRFSHPQWWIETLRRDWPEQWATILEASNQQAPLWLRLNPQRVNRVDYLDQLQAAGMNAESCDYLPQALRLPRAVAVERLPGFAAGSLSIQDGSAQLASLALGVEPGMRVLDACAAPGGKSAALLEQQPGLRLLALDNDAKRVERMRRGMRRLDLQLDLRCADAGAPEQWWDGERFERILLDAPCSASGVVRRQPDSKWHRRADDLPALAAQQARLLRALWPLLTPGGRLLYATCSLFKIENQQQIDRFLAEHADARAIDLAECYGRRSGSGRQCLPGDDQRDGFYYALIERQAN